MKVEVELELEIDLSELSISEIQRIIKQLIDTDESRVVRDATVTDFRIKK